MTNEEKRMYDWYIWSVSTMIQKNMIDLRTLKNQVKELRYMLMADFEGPPPHWESEYVNPRYFTILEIVKKKEEAMQYGVDNYDKIKQGKKMKEKWDDNR